MPASPENHTKAPDANDTRVVRDAFTNARDLIDAVLGDDRFLRRLELVADRTAACVNAGGKILAIGNGGSMADAIHFCEELTGKFRNPRPPVAALACSDPGHLTCVANDYGYDQVFARWISALAREQDILFALTTSGNSRNILLAVEAAKDRGVPVVGLLGRGGGILKGRCDFEWVVPDSRAGPSPTERIQEVHMLILHTLIDRIETRLFPHTATQSP